MHDCYMKGDYVHISFTRVKYWYKICDILVQIIHVNLYQFFTAWNLLSVKFTVQHRIQTEYFHLTSFLYQMSIRFCWSGDVWRLISCLQSDEPLSLCTHGIFSCFCRLLIFFQNQLFRKKNLSGVPSKCQTIWGQTSGQIWI